MLNHCLMVLKFSQAEQLLGGYWFLKTLFYASFISFVCIYLATYIETQFPKAKFKRTIGVCIGLSVVSSFLFSLFDLHIPIFGIAVRELIATCFILMGYLYRNHISHLIRYSNISYITLFLSAISLTTIGSLFWKMSMTDIVTLHIVPYLLSSVIMSILILETIKLFYKESKVSKLFKFMGDNSIEILTWHFLSFKLANYLIVSLYNLPVGQMAEFPTISEYSKHGFWILYLISGITIPLLIRRTILSLKRCNK